MAEANTPGSAGTGDKRRSRVERKAAPPSRGSAHKGQRRALIVGINDYEGTVNDLPSCVADAEAMHKMLSDRYQFDEARLLRDAEATEANVVAGLEHILTGLDKDGRAVFYFSGHGSTARRGSTIEECLVLHDAYFFDDRLVELSTQAPPGVLSVIMDSCFSGGLEKQLLKAVFNPGASVERTRVKAYTRQDPREFQEHNEDQEEVGKFIRFGGTPFVPPIQRAGTVLFGDAAKALIPAPQSDEVGQPRLNGLLLSACLETETAAASTSLTDGKSAFTYCLLDVLQRSNPAITNAALIEAVQKRIKAIGLGQTPLIKEPPIPAGLGHKSFITFEEPRSSELPAGEGSSATAALITMLTALNSPQAQGEAKMDAATIINIIMQIIAALQRGQQSSQPNKGLADVLPLILAAQSNAAPANKGFADLLPTVLPLLLKNNAAPPQNKLFGIDDAILIPAIAGVISSAVSKNSQTNSRLFGIDDAILIPAIASVVGSAIQR
jgi:Caspase domain